MDEDRLLDLVAELCAPVHAMAEGRVIASGTMAQVRNDPEVAEAYLGMAIAPAE